MSEYNAQNARYWLPVIPAIELTQLTMKTDAVTSRIISFSNGQITVDFRNSVMRGTISPEAHTVVEAITEWSNGVVVRDEKITGVYARPEYHPDLKTVLDQWSAIHGPEKRIQQVVEHPKKQPPTYWDLLNKTGLGDAIGLKIRRQANLISRNGPEVGWFVFTSATSHPDTNETIWRYLEDRVLVTDLVTELPKGGVFLLLLDFSRNTVVFVENGDHPKGIDQLLQDRWGSKAMTRDVIQELASSRESNYTGPHRVVDVAFSKHGADIVYLEIAGIRRNIYIQDASYISDGDSMWLDPFKNVYHT